MQMLVLQVHITLKKLYKLSWVKTRYGINIMMNKDLSIKYLTMECL